MRLHVAPFSPVPPFSPVNTRFVLIHHRDATWFHRLHRLWDYDFRAPYDLRRTPPDTRDRFRWPGASTNPSRDLRIASGLEASLAPCTTIQVLLLRREGLKKGFPDQK